LGMLGGFAIAARELAAGADPHRLAGYGAVVGIAAFSLVIFATPSGQAGFLYLGATLIGLGAGLFSVGTLTAAMALSRQGSNGLALGAWGAVQATSAGLAIAIGAFARDAISSAAIANDLGVTLAGPATGYGFVYFFEIMLLFATIVALGPLVRGRAAGQAISPTRFGLSEFPT